MAKKEKLDFLLQENKGILKTADAVDAGISRSYFLEYVKERGLERVAQGLYLAQDAWEDGMYLLQARYSQAIFSHETALYLLGLAGREPLQYTVTVKAGYNVPTLKNAGIKVYTIKKELFETGVIYLPSPAGHMLRVYNAERTVCDILRSRSNIEIQDMQTALKEYVKQKDKNLPLLMRYAKYFRVEKILGQYLEVLL